MNLLVTGELAGGAGAFWIGFLIDLAVKGTLFLLAAYLLSTVLRNSRPAARSRIWTAFFVLLVIVPVYSMVLPSIYRAPEKVLDSWLGWDPFVTVVQVDRAEFPAVETVLEPSASASHPENIVASQRVSAGATAGSAGLRPAVSRLSWTAVVVAWLVGFAVLVSWMLLRLGGTWLAVRQTQPFPTNTADTLLREVTDGIAPGRRPVLRLTTSGTVPYLAGILRPKLVLPAGAVAWPPERLRMVLVHEMTHLRRRDLARRVLGDVVVAVFWFHPLAWAATRRAALEQELACDEEVCRRTERGIDYARLLVSFASGALRRWPVGQPGLASAAGLELRMKHILSNWRPRYVRDSCRERVLRWSGLLASAAVFILCLCVLTSALVKPESGARTLPPRVAVPMMTAQIERPSSPMSIHEAAARGDRESVTRLLETDPRLLDRPDHKGMTPLAIAAWNMHLDLVMDLLARGADPDRKNNNGLTPLFCAMDRDRPQLTRILLDAGADRHTRGFRNWTLLHMAARNGDWETAQILIDAGLDVNACDSRGSAPLDYSHRYGTEIVARVLVSAGAKKRKDLPPLPNLFKLKSRSDVNIL